MRVVGLDLGARRIGVAVSDPTRMLARPVAVVPAGALADSVERIAAEIARLSAEAEPVSSVVVGLPRRLDGSATGMTPVATAFAAALQARTGLPVTLQDERLTSHEAEMRLAATDRDWRSRKKRLDAAAAAVILQDYLDEQHSAVGQSLTGTDQ